MPVTNTQRSAPTPRPKSWQHLHKEIACRICIHLFAVGVLGHAKTYCLAARKHDAIFYPANLENKCRTQLAFCAGEKTRPKGGFGSFRRFRLSTYKSPNFSPYCERFLTNTFFLIFLTSHSLNRLTASNPLGFPRFKNSHVVGQNSLTHNLNRLSFRLAVLVD